MTRITGRCVARSRNCYLTLLVRFIVSLLPLSSRVTGRRVAWSRGCYLLCFVESLVLVLAPLLHSTTPVSITLQSIPLASYIPFSPFTANLAPTLWIESPPGSSFPERLPLLPSFLPSPRQVDANSTPYLYSTHSKHESRLRSQLKQLIYRSADF